MDKVTTLELFEFYRSGSTRFRKEMRDAASPAHLAKGDYYAREGDRCEQMALVGEGRLRVYKVGESGREITLYNVGPGEGCLLNVSCLLTERPSPAFAVVEQPVSALMFSGQRFREWIATNEGVRAFVFDLLAKRITSVMSLVEEVTFRRMDERVAEFLRDRFDGNSHNGGVLNVTHEQIALELGTAREVVSRLLKEFERMGAITLSRGRIVLENAQALDVLGKRE